MTPDGTKHSQKKQMEILQARTTSGSALQVVRAQTSQTTSSRHVYDGNGIKGAEAMSDMKQYDTNMFLRKNERLEKPKSLSLANMSRPFSRSYLQQNTKSSIKSDWDNQFER